ncbi:head maturation protease, ClpP-related [Methylorubrum zatmanii]
MIRNHSAGLARLVEVGTALRATGLRVMARERPGRIKLPGKVDVAALSKPEIYDRWNAAIRAADITANVIPMYDVIGRDYWSGGGITVESVSEALDRFGGADVEIHINSPGGDMFEGIGIYNRLQQYPGKITVKVFGLAASAASVIAMASDEILMGPASFIMIHNCWVVAVGNRHDFRETADFLEPFDAAMVGVYAARTGSDPAEIAAWMDAETYMNGQQAKERGFADGLFGEDAVTIDEEAGASAMAGNAVRKVELNLCKSMTRAQARDLIAKVKGTPGAAPNLAPAMPGAGDLSWLGAAAELTASLRS